MVRGAGESKSSQTVSNIYSLCYYDNKSQRLSLNSALIMMDIGSSIFTCGQAYVSLSSFEIDKSRLLINVNFASIKAHFLNIVDFDVFTFQTCQK